MATFDCFPRLPLELRRRIWELTVEPRIVDVHVDHYDKPILILSSTPPPAVLHVCYEARNQGLYQQAFSRPGSERYIWVNFAVDMISIGETMFDVVKPEADLIRRLKIERENDELFYHRCSEDLRWFSNVVETHVVCIDGPENWHLAGEEIYWPCGRENLWFIEKGTGEMMNSMELDKIQDEILAKSCREAEEAEEAEAAEAEAAEAAEADLDCSLAGMAIGHHLRPL